ncbi:MAG: NAD(P)H-hydrate dehydratase [Bacteroidota bacterium]|nr:MAG: NAD(P)H-hydrate dehydratase [Bacteroidota bacterium]
MGKVFTAEQIRAIDAYTIEHEPIQSVDLMERAATALADWICQHFEPHTAFVFFAGPGNNGGDAWALARILHKRHFHRLRFFLLQTSGELSPDSEINRRRLDAETNLKPHSIGSEAEFPEIAPTEWIIDALFGSGLKRPLEGVECQLVKYLNRTLKAGTIAIDIPSGLFCDSNHANISECIVHADYTLSFQFPKFSFFLSDHQSIVGHWEVLDIGLHARAIEETPTLYRFIAQPDMAPMLKKRSKFSHKGSYGHALIVAGSYGMMGAAVLSTRAAVSAGAGLVTAHIPRLGYEIIQTTVPEALTEIDESDLIFTSTGSLDRYTAIAIGPGINTKHNTTKALKVLLGQTKVPLVIDADGLNILADNRPWLEELPAGTILTPHPGEFDRLTQKHKSHYDRILSQQQFSEKYQVVIVLKGAHTSVSFSDRSLWFNTTGNAGMATGGSGDVLTGVICALLAQGYTNKEATLLGVYIHGMAGDLALMDKGFHALTASDIINKLGKAFKTIE